MLSEDILRRFDEAIKAAGKAGEPEPTGMVLATCDGDGNLSTRTVLLKGVDKRGFVFYTNTLSIKGRQLRQFPRAAVTFLWKAAFCQVHAAGAIERVTEAEANAYFASRERESQIGAWASRQSEVLESRAVLEARVKSFEEKFSGGDVPRPPHWTGYRLVPEYVEFWHGRDHRLHDRFRYTRENGDWILQRLYP